MDEQIGTGDLRYNESVDGGFGHVTLRDADDGDVIVLSEETVELLYYRLRKTLESWNEAGVYQWKKS